MDHPRRSPTVASLNEREVKMEWLWVLAVVVYVGLFFWLGLSTLRNGHGWLFFFGIFFPILWIFGAFARPRVSTT
jgi:hypothetical protein